MTRQPAVYILASKAFGTLYIGVTSNLPQRIWQHQNGEAPGFTARYAVHRLVYYEMHQDMRTAIEREKCLKRWKREWKIHLIRRQNPTDEIWQIPFDI